MFGDGAAGVVPVPGVEGEAYAWSALFSEGQHFGHLPDEFVLGCLADVERAQEFETETALGLG